MQLNICSPRQKVGLLCLLAALLLTAMAGIAQSRRLVTGKNISWPPLGTQLNVGSLPMNIVLSPDGKYALVSDMGFDQYLTSINAKTGGYVSNIFYDNCDYCYYQNTNGLYYGIAFGANGTVRRARRKQHD
jgi:hypothetical protein